MNEKYLHCELDDNVNDLLEYQPPKLCSSVPNNLTTINNNNNSYGDNLSDGIGGDTIADEILSTIAINNDPGNVHYHNNQHLIKQSMPFECSSYLVSDFQTIKSKLIYFKIV